MAVLVAIAMIAMACGSGDETKSLAAACRADVAVSDGFDGFFATELPAGEADEPPSAAYKAAAAASFEQHLARPFADASASAPAALADDMSTAYAAYRRFALTGDYSFITPEVDARFDRIESYFYERCDGKRHDITATDFAYPDAPTEISSGVTRFRLKNTGTEPHEMVVLARAPGVTQSFEEILALWAKGEGSDRVETVTSAFAEPGRNGYTTHDMEPGHYVMVCRFPKGSTSEDQSGDGPAHFTLGMKRELTVT